MNEEQIEEDVNLIQQIIRVLYPESKIEPNGHYGRFTSRYVKTFQEANDLKVDGMVGNTTFFKLRGKPDNNCRPNLAR